MNNHFYLITAVVVFVSVITLGACSNNKNKANLLNPDVKYRADTMYSRHRTELLHELDSLCLAKMPELVSAARDSLLEHDIKMIDKFRNR